jgi:hypothetical protein
MAGLHVQRNVHLVRGDAVEPDPNELRVERRPGEPFSDLR